MKMKRESCDLQPFFFLFLLLVLGGDEKKSPVIRNFFSFFLFVLKGDQKRILWFATFFFLFVLRRDGKVSLRRGRGRERGRGKMVDVRAVSRIPFMIQMKPIKSIKQSYSLYLIFISLFFSCFSSRSLYY